MRIPALLVLLSVVSAYAAPPKPCDLVTPAQVNTIIGGNVSPGQGAVSPTISKCAFSDPNQSKEFVVNYFAIASMNLPQDMALQMMKSGSDLNPVPGLGDYANWQDSPGGKHDLVVLYHGYMIGLQYSNAPEKPSPKDAMIALMKQVMAKF